MNVENSSFMTADEAVILYNLRNTNPDKYENEGKCIFPMCEEGKCICLDVQQAEVLHMMTYGRMKREQGRHLRFDPDKVQSFVYNTTELPHSVCNQSYAGNTPFRLCSFKQFQSEMFKDFLKKIPADNCTYERCRDLFLGLSIFYYVNRTEELQDRDSVLYLALYGNDCDGSFLNLLFDSVTISLIERTIRDEPIASLCHAIEKICNRLRQLGENRKQTFEGVLRIAEAFKSDVEAVEMPIGLKLANNLTDYVQDANVYRQYCNTHGVELSEEEKFDDEELKIIARMEANEQERTEKILPHYALMKSVCEVVGMHITLQEDFFLEKRLRDIDRLRDCDISRLIEILQKISKETSNEDSKKAVLKNIVVLLNEYGKYGAFTSESMKALEDIFSK